MTVTVEFTPSALKSDKVLAEAMGQVADSLARSKRCVVVTGAGISVSGGIPDFRSADGLYNLVKQKYPHAVVKGKDLFDANLFKDEVSTAVFYTFVAELKDTINRASITKAHEFIKNLEDRGKLLRCYTQNIDGLEPRLGMCAELDNAESPVRGKGKERAPPKPDVRVVQLHGDLDRVVCTLCRAMFEFEESHRVVFHAGEPPACPTCLETEQTRLAAGKRKLGVGTLRPNIVLYNEHHSKGDIIAKLVSGDIRKKPDLLIVMGTSLKVVGIKRVVKEMAKAIHANPKGRVVLVNQTGVSKEWENVFDYHIQAPADAVVEHLWETLDRKDEADKKRAEKAAENKLPNPQSTPRISTLFKPTKASAGKIVAKSPKATASPSPAASPRPALTQQKLSFSPSPRASRPLDISGNTKRLLSPSSVTNVPVEPEPMSVSGAGSPTKRRRTLEGGNLPLSAEHTIIAQASVLETSGFIAVAAPKTIGNGKPAAPGRAMPSIVSATKVVKTKSDQVVVSSMFKTTKSTARVGEKKVSGIVPRVAAAPVARTVV